MMFNIEQLMSRTAGVIVRVRLCLWGGETHTVSSVRRVYARGGGGGGWWCPRSANVNTVVCSADRWRLEALVSGTWSLPKQTKAGCARVSVMHVRLRALMRASVLLLSATVCRPKQTGLMRSSSWDRERESE